MTFFGQTGSWCLGGLGDESMVSFSLEKIWLQKTETTEMLQTSNLSLIFGTSLLGVKEGGGGRCRCPDGSAVSPVVVVCAAATPCNLQLLLLTTSLPTFSLPPALLFRVPSRFFKYPEGLSDVANAT